MVENAGPGAGTDPLTGAWLTPGGNGARFVYRPDTNDWNTISAVLSADEYGLRGRVLEGLLVDVGAHVGAWAIAALLDNPGAWAIAVEALPENVDLIRRSAALNGLGPDRLEVLEGAATDDDSPVAIAYGAMSGGPGAFDYAHRFVGGANWAGEPNRAAIECLPIRLEDLAPREPIELLKIDCEGCEWRFLTSPDLGRVREIVGEVHPTEGRRTADLVALLSRTHRVVELPSADGFGGFRAIRLEGKGRAR